MLLTHMLDAKGEDLTMEPSDKQSNPVLSVRDLQTHFFTDDGTVKAVDEVSFDLHAGKTLALVGESGCGKSVTSNSILRLIQKPGKIVAGTITIDVPGEEPIEVAGLSEKDERLYRVRGGLVSMIFQEPMTALSPVHTIGNQICEAILLHQDMSEAEAESLAIEMLGRVGIPGPEKRLKQYPFELSGGMRQRVCIAMAVACKPKVLIADEPTTALDVTIQAQILHLIADLQQEYDTAVLLITHDLGVVAQVADDVAVMYLGKIVEKGTVHQVLKKPRHPYTQGLLASLPSLNHGEQLFAIPGSVPSPGQRPPGCFFHPRCSFCDLSKCATGGPPPLETLGDGVSVRCVRHAEIPAFDIEHLGEKA